MIRPLVPLDVLERTLPTGPRDRLAESLREVAADPSRLHRRFPAAGRDVGRGTLVHDAREVPVPDAVRVLLLASALPAAGDEALLQEARALYRFGDADEKRAVLHALNGWDDVDAHDLVEDALRTNDTRLVEAAMGAHARHLDAAAWRQGVLKCLFTGVDVRRVADLATRADPELGAMAARYGREREAAGRVVPADVRHVIDLSPTPSEA